MALYTLGRQSLRHGLTTDAGPEPRPAEFVDEAVDALRPVQHPLAHLEPAPAVGARARRRRGRTRPAFREVRPVRAFEPLVGRSDKAVGLVGRRA
eukprot:CAMPEP_0185712622 /NCGR_PEP_ID=MMETSP1164-20130828/35194_1 /TAXON_ID=1104430 /ORGANISM="Chrysoreinhardia sp, Strain CCMP2950" /LENGTH=94 /DNA_ID=CAMNT_0028380177 /DNA_START=32 /DNA_END=313 /DNA_ORIENTATION=-